MAEELLTWLDKSLFIIKYYQRLKISWSF